ncbi:MAG: ComEC/Rec2 family competence protein [Erythrobacter sp.]
MATRGTPLIPMGEADDDVRRVVRRPWRMRGLLSSFADAAEAFLADAKFDRGPWLAVAFAAGDGLWFGLATAWQSAGAIGGLVLLALAALALWRDRDDRALILAATVSLSTACAAGVGVVWARSSLVGTEPIATPRFERIDARILSREEQPADDRVRLVVAAREPLTGRALAYRINVPTEADTIGLQEGARIRFSARLMPPSPPIVPGAYNFARRAWFEGLAATGSVVGGIEVVGDAAHGEAPLAALQRGLSDHVRSRLEGSSGAIAATLASGDRGAIAAADEEAMRDAGLTHLLSISGLHVSAVIAAAYLISLKLLALWPWLALRVRLPLVAAAAAAVAGIGYTLLTGAEVPTVRSCIGAVLVLLALALGREPLSMRMVAVAAMVVLCLWPESLIGPSFQMSFAAVLAIVALHNSQPIRNYLAPRDEGLLRKWGRRIAVLFLTGLVIEIALMPVVLFHFHRAGIYGAGANLLAIPLVTFVSMPLVALALMLDLVGLGGPIWWLAGKSVECLLAIAHFVASQPGAVKLAPPIPLAAIVLFWAGGLWLALWHGKQRRWGLLPALLAAFWMATIPPPDVLVTRDGRDVGLLADDGRLVVLREGEGGYARDNLVEIAARSSEPVAIASWPSARCSDDFCSIVLERGGKPWRILVALSRNLIEERALSAACERVDVVIAARYLPRSCRPRWVRIDRRFLDREGGVSLDLQNQRMRTVAQGEGEHGWWRPPEPRRYVKREATPEAVAPENAGAGSAPAVEPVRTSSDQ